MSTGILHTTPYDSGFELTEFATCGALVAFAKRAGLSEARRNIATQAGNPDPFNLIAQATQLPSSATITTTAPGGHRISPDSLDAALVSSLARNAAPIPDALVQALRAHLNDRPAGPRTRAALGTLPPHHPLSPCGRYPSYHVSRPTVLSSRWHPNATMGLPPHAIHRTLHMLADNRIATGTDYGATLFDGSRWQQLPFPPGSRREARCVEAMTVHKDRLIAATSKAWFEWDLNAKLLLHRRHPDDAHGGHDDVRALLSTSQGLITGWRTRLDGLSGHGETLSLIADPAGVVWCGTRTGELYIGGVSNVLQRLGKPVRHMAFANGSLWLAAAGALHSYNGALWSRTVGEPTSLFGTPGGPLWWVRQGKVGATTTHPANPSPIDSPFDLPVKRPWSLAATADTLWVGAPGGVLHVSLSNEDVP